ncbi:RNA polymerase factor sigma-54 [Desulfallas thermosapovorans]|uniref:RNA polymerase RpoN-/SigL-like sigma 54 subunit n=1 Tax=Desulfallas thermosapovorans DSM 6562 TaxID=1121431 RepID=A0A5S4ZS46_9FIRM|nr:RNA polymerase factor sigma-54 [Desulfallas thermosapovorans]TYO94853.1 RNA polymerase RpoN-/SigL-like sigma 54 subunit [Desulfallas thermosapovorans DSM 6562]
MRMGYGLNIVQTQKLIMTPELRQAITVLQLSSLELDMYVQQQLQENPLLEVREEDFERTETDKPPGETGAGEREYDIDWQDYFHDSSDLGMPRSEVQREQNECSYEQFVTRAPNLMEHLLQQLGLVKCNKRKKAIAEYIIGNINDNGYLGCPIDEIANQMQEAPGEVLDALRVVQSFDPPGVGARSLQECLQLQLNYLGLEDPLVNVVVERHLLDLADGKFSRMAQLLGVPVQEIQRVADLLKTLDPKPGRNFSSSNDNRYIVPDIILNKVDGEYVIITNDNSLPRLTINNTYRAVLGQDKGDNNTKKFVEHKLNAAAWLIKSIEQRRLTLYKVTKCLVDLQRDFLDYGVKFLKPLNLKTVADIVGLHESTVSRATANKYIQTPQGVFEMKYFFSSGLSNLGGSAVSAESIKKTLQEIVNGEDAKKPLNDQQIADIFNRRGIKISRRTVAKYRDELNIPPIRKRKRY